MYFPDVVSLKQFYSSRLGILSQHMIARSITRMWPECSNENILALGYPIPYLDSFINSSNTLMVCMPAHQGGIYWPSQHPNQVALVKEGELPVANNTVNRVLLVHMLEQCELRAVMQEVWRVLTPGGRMLAVVPNRLSFWARSAGSPFGYGRPFTLHQIKGVLEECKLTFMRSSSTLFALPSQARWIVRTAPAIEIIGATLLPLFGGVLLVEAEKQIYAAMQEPLVARRMLASTMPAQALRRTNGR